MSAARLDEGFEPRLRELEALPDPMTMPVGGTYLALLGDIVGGSNILDKSSSEGESSVYKRFLLANVGSYETTFILAGVLSFIGTHALMLAC